MAALINSLSRRRAQITSIDDWANLWNLDALPMMLQTTYGRVDELPDYTFLGHTITGYLRNSVVFASLALRARLFGEARFQFQQLRNGNPGKLFGTPDLSVLEHPETGKTTHDLLESLILDADLGGNGFILGRPGNLHRLRPDWTTIAYGSKNNPDPKLGAWDPEAQVIGYSYYPGGMASGADPIHYLPEEVCHFVATKDPLARNRGISLLTAGLREVLADNAAMTHKLEFFNHAATPNLALKFPPTMSKAKAEEWIELFDSEHRGATNAWKTVYLGSGVETTQVGLNFKDMDYAQLQGKAETRIAMLTGMHPVIVALSESLERSSLNPAAFSAAARLVGDSTLRPLWGNVAGSLETIVPPPPGSRLWYDDKNIPFLRQDLKDQAAIVQSDAATIGQLIRDGFEPASAIDAVTAADMGRLVHTGLVSVQLQPPGTILPPQPSQPLALRATRDFWAIEEPLARLGTIRKGMSVNPDHPLVAEFPSLFEPEPPKAGPEPIVSRDTVLATRAALQASGRLPSHAAIARELNVNERTVRRRLNGS